MNEVLALRQAAGFSQVELSARSGVAQPNIAAYESGRRKASAQMLARLRDATRPKPSEAVATNREALVQILKAHRMSEPRVFGSAAAGSDAPGSDLDLVVDLAGDGDLLDIIDGADALEELLGIKVDIVTSRSLRADHEINRTAAPL